MTALIYICLHFHNIGLPIALQFFSCMHERARCVRRAGRILGQKKKKRSLSEHLDGERRLRQSVSNPLPSLSIKTDGERQTTPGHNHPLCPFQSVSLFLFFSPSFLIVLSIARLELSPGCPISEQRGEEERHAVMDAPVHELNHHTPSSLLVWFCARRP